MEVLDNQNQEMGNEVLELEDTVDKISGGKHFFFIYRFLRKFVTNLFQVFFFDTPLPSMTLG